MKLKRHRQDKRSGGRASYTGGTLSAAVGRARLRNPMVLPALDQQVSAIIHRAAALHGMSDRDFVVDAARLVAEETLIEQRMFPLANDNFELVCSILDHPAGGPGYEKLMAAEKPWTD